MRLSLKEVIEVVGTIGVIGSLLFVGYQLVLERRVAISTQYQNRAQLVVQYTQSGFENDAFISEEAIRFEITRPYWWSDEIETIYKSGSTSMEGILRFERYFQMMMHSLDNNHYQYRQGFFDEGLWQGNLNVIRLAMANTIIRQTWTSAAGISPEFKEVLAQIVAEMEE